MIEGFVGRPGSGKSYTVTAHALELAGRGRNVFANFPINAPNCYTFKPEELMLLPPGVVIIDEAHLLFPARQSLKLPMSWLGAMSQTRKAGWDILWVAQHETRIDRVIRDVTSYIWLCSSWFKWNDHPALFKAEAYEPERFRDPKHKLQTKWRMFDKKVADAYDTFERLEAAAHTQSEKDVYADFAKKQKAMTAERAGAA